MPASSSFSQQPNAVALAQITDFLRNEIPLTIAMELKVTGWDGQTVTLMAPLAPNHNHTDTAFGGSISSVAILAGYSALHLLFAQRELSTRLLVQKSTTEFIRPIDTDLIATCSCPAPEALGEFLTTLEKKRRARITLESQVLSNTLLAARHTGVYVALLY